MATLQQRSDSYRILFLWHGKRLTFTVGDVSLSEAEAKRSQVEYLLMRLQQRLLELPTDCDITTFLKYDGHPPTKQNGNTTVTLPDKFSLGKLRDRYIETHKQSLELSTTKGIRTHFKHLVDTFGELHPIAELSLAELQKHIDRRSRVKFKKRLITPATIKKEIISLRTAWNWGVRMKFVSGPYPSKGLRYPKSDEKPACMTQAEILRRIKAGGDPKILWDCLFLTIEEVSELLQYVEQQAEYDFIYPMICTAAHTGARRSELIRAETTDIDIVGGTMQIRERKRVHGKRTTRRVPLSPFLAKVLQSWLANHPGGKYLFCHSGNIPRSRKDHSKFPCLSPQQVRHNLKHVLSKSKWKVVRGWHILRHSFISACVMQRLDQRVIDSWVGHCTDEQRRRYTHLYPQVEQQAIRSVFG